jgi:hypothetical protein
MTLVPGRFYRSAADEVWCCYVAQDGRQFGVVRLRDGRVSKVDPLGRGDNLILLGTAFPSCAQCGV